ncbi:hypothetical protein HZB60_09105 [candidate division KSB1 bacterium]|nr:hypothetical protein [candidate division KSB1 bacterium]
MAYKSSSNLSYESASKLGHLSVIQDPFIEEMVQSFELVKRDKQAEPLPDMTTIDVDGTDPLDFIICVDGSFSVVPNTLAPDKTLGYIKIGVLNISLSELRQANAPIVNPEVVQKILSRYADTQSTVLPLSNVTVGDRTLFESIRHAIETTLRHFNDGALYDTLRFLVSQEWEESPPAWQGETSRRPHFQCPFCDQVTYFPRSQLQFTCTHCARELVLSDYLGLMLDVSETSNDSKLAVNLMGVLEHLTLIHYLRVLVERGPKFHSKVLLLKDGPLMLRGQYARLVDPIRGYLHHLYEQGFEFYLAGVEKDGAFVQFIEQVRSAFPEKGSVFTPNSQFILDRIKHSGANDTIYGQKVLYGQKSYLRIDERNIIVMSVPSRKTSFSMYDPDAGTSDLIGLPRIASTLSRLVSRQYQNALVPITAVNKIASLSFYPSNNILERFTDSLMRRGQ